DSRLYKEDTGAKGCFSETDGSCTAGTGLTGATSVAINPTSGGNFVYVGGNKSIAEFKRTLSSGELKQLSAPNACINDGGSDGCTNSSIPIPGTVSEMTLSNDGKHLYAVVSAPGEGELLVFSRAAGGALTPVECWNNSGTNGCNDARAMDAPQGVSLDRS